MINKARFFKYLALSPTRNMQKVDLGTLDFRTASSTITGFYQVLNFCSTYGAKAENTVECDVLTTADYTDLYYQRADNAVCVLPSNGRLYVRKSDCATVEDLKTALSSHYLYFESE